MRFSNLLSISIRNVKSKWGVLIAMVTAIGMFCLCFAEMIFFTVQWEKSEPFELVAASENDSNITETTLYEVLETAGVKDATLVMQIPVQMYMGVYSAQFTLTGITPSYLEVQNGIPEDGVMPYIALNKAACKLFLKDGGDELPTNQPPEIDWLNTKALLKMDEESTSITAKVCDILENEKDDEPAAYVSLNAAKEFAGKNGQTPICTTVYVRVKNIGCAEGVTRNMEALDLSAVNMDDGLQAKWDGMEKEMTYLIMVAVLCLLCSGILLFAWRRMSFYEQKEAYTMLHWLGTRQRDIEKFFVVQSLFTTLAGVLVGWLMVMTLPSFLPQELKGVSVFMEPIPVNAVAIAAVLCMGINIPVWLRKKHI